MQQATLANDAVAPRGFRVSLPFLIGAWRTITWKHIAWTALFGLFAEVLFITVSHSFNLFLHADWGGRFRHFYSGLWSEEAAAFFFLLCIIAADHAVRRGAARFRTFFIASIVAALLGAAFNASVLYLTGWFDQPFVRWWWKPVHPISHFMWYLLMGGFFAFVYADVQRNRATAGRLRAAVMQRAQAVRDVLQTRLRAMQARVEPQFLFDTLGRIKEIYASDAQMGQRTLDELITYLRMAMPQIGVSVSTLAREIELVRSYAAILSGCSENRIALSVVRHDDWTATPFPPMLLLPLIEHAVRSGSVTRPSDGAMTLHAIREGNTLRVTIGHGGRAFAADAEHDAVNQVREHLRVLFDDAARLTLRTRDDGGSEALFEVPA